MAVVHARVAMILTGGFYPKFLPCEGRLDYQDHLHESESGERGPSRPT